MSELPPSISRLRVLKKRERIRRRVWWLLELHGVVTFPLPVFGRIPNFIGSEEAAKRFAELPEFEVAQCIYCALDHSLVHVRRLILARGKKLATALPKVRGIIEIDEHVHIKAASSVKGFERYGKPLQTPIDMFVVGSVAVDKFGNRLGVGKGFTDMEWRWLNENSMVRQHCKVVTLVHPLQIVEDLEPYALETDLKVDIIVTPDEVIHIGN